MIGLLLCRFNHPPAVQSENHTSCSVSLSDRVVPSVLRFVHELHFATLKVRPHDEAGVLEELTRVAPMALEKGKPHNPMIEWGRRWGSEYTK